MSLKRLILRSTLDACLSNGGEEPYPTIAAKRVYDSKIDSYDLIEEGQLEPVITIYTDADRGFSYNQNRHEDRIIEIIIELMVVLKIDDNLNLKENDEGEVDIALGFVGTDAQLEAKLDVFEEQVKNCLTNPHNIYSQIWQKMVFDITGWSSQRVASNEAGTKLAARQIQFMAHIGDDIFPTDSNLNIDEMTNFFKAKFSDINVNGRLDETLDELTKSLNVSNDRADDLESIKITPQN